MSHCSNHENLVITPDLWLPGPGPVWEGPLCCIRPGIFRTFWQKIKYWWLSITLQKSPGVPDWCEWASMGRYSFKWQLFLSYFNGVCDKNLTKINLFSEKLYLFWTILTKKCCILVIFTHVRACYWWRGISGCIYNRLDSGGGLICLISVSGDTGQQERLWWNAETWPVGIIIWKWVDLTHLNTGNCTHSVNIS